MVWNQGPCVALGLGLFEDDGETVKERVAVLVVSEKLSSFNSPGHDVLEEARGIKSWLAGHGVSHRTQGTESVIEPRRREGR